MVYAFVSLSLKYWEYLAETSHFKNLDDNVFFQQKKKQDNLIAIFNQYDAVDVSNVESKLMTESHEKTKVLSVVELNKGMRDIIPILSFDVFISKWAESSAQCDIDQQTIKLGVGQFITACLDKKATSKKRKRKDSDDDSDRQTTKKTTQTSSTKKTEEKQSTQKNMRAIYDTAQDNIDKEKEKKRKERHMSMTPSPPPASTDDEDDREDGKDKKKEKKKEKKYKTKATEQTSDQEKEEEEEEKEEEKRKQKHKRSRIRQTKEDGELSNNSSDDDEKRVVIIESLYKKFKTDNTAASSTKQTPSLSKSESDLEQSDRTSSVWSPPTTTSCGKDRLQHSIDMIESHLIEKKRQKKRVRFTANCQKQSRDTSPTSLFAKEGDSFKEKELVPEKIKSKKEHHKKHHKKDDKMTKHKKQKKRDQNEKKPENDEKDKAAKEERRKLKREAQLEHEHQLRDKMMLPKNKPHKDGDDASHKKTATTTVKTKLIYDHSNFRSNNESFVFDNNKLCGQYNDVFFNVNIISQGLVRIDKKTLHTHLNVSSPRSLYAASGVQKKQKKNVLTKYFKDVLDAYKVVNGKQCLTFDIFRRLEKCQNFLTEVQNNGLTSYNCCEIIVFEAACMVNIVRAWFNSITDSTNVNEEFFPFITKDGFLDQVRLMSHFADLATYRIVGFLSWLDVVSRSVDVDVGVILQMMVTGKIIPYAECIEATHIDSLDRRMVYFVNQTEDKIGNLSTEAINSFLCEKIQLSKDLEFAQRKQDMITTKQKMFLDENNTKPNVKSFCMVHPTDEKKMKKKDDKKKAKKQRNEMKQKTQTNEQNKQTNEMPPKRQTNEMTQKDIGDTLTATAVSTAINNSITTSTPTHNTTTTTAADYDSMQNNEDIEELLSDIYDSCQENERETENAILSICEDESQNSLTSCDVIISNDQPRWCDNDDNLSAKQYIPTVVDVVEPLGVESEPEPYVPQTYNQHQLHQRQYYELQKLKHQQKQQNELVYGHIDLL